MRMLATITKPTNGTIAWNGTDIVKSPDVLRDVLGYLPQDFGVYQNLSAIEFLEYMAAITLPFRIVGQQIAVSICLILCPIDSANR